MIIDDQKLRLWLEAAIESAFRAGALEERAAVVAWLEECANDAIAESIERGEHRREEER